MKQEGNVVAGTLAELEMLLVAGEVVIDGRSVAMDLEMGMGMGVGMGMGTGMALGVV